MARDPCIAWNSRSAIGTQLRACLANYRDQRKHKNQEDGGHRYHDPQALTPALTKCNEEMHGGATLFRCIPPRKGPARDLSG
jgi:hypothetical protein